jgi:hypothetical protein
MISYSVRIVTCVQCKFTICTLDSTGCRLDTELLQKELECSNLKSKKSVLKYADLATYHI